MFDMESKYLQSVRVRGLRRRLIRHANEVDLHAFAKKCIHGTARTRIGGVGRKDHHPGPLPCQARSGRGLRQLLFRSSSFIQRSCQHDFLLSLIEPILRP